MRKWFTRGAVVTMAGVAGVALLVAAPASAGEVFSWTTEDGGYAFTDDADNIPARYRDAASAGELGKLGDYARFTLKDPRATARYEQRLAVRLAYLRALNAMPQQVLPGQSPIRQVISLRTGGSNSPSLELQPGGEGGPIVVERLRFRPKGQMATRHNLIVRQGDKTLAIVKGRLEGETNANLRVRDEEELER